MRAEDDVAELQGDPYQRVLPALAARTWTDAAGAAAGCAEEGLEDVAESAELARPAAAERRVAAAHVVPASFVRVAQHVVGVGHQLEPLGGVRTRVDVGVQLPRQAPVRLLDVVGAGVASDTQHFV